MPIFLSNTSLYCTGSVSDRYILIFSRFEEINTGSTTCKDDETCIGGIARTYTAVKELLAEKPDSIFLNAGDNFQGTLWYNVFKWNVTQHFLNLLPADAIVRRPNILKIKLKYILLF